MGDGKRPERIAIERARSCATMLRNAASLPFYAAHWRALGPRDDGMPVLAQLPTIGRQDIARLCAGIVSLEDLGGFSITSGSLGTPLFRPWSRTDAERMASWNLSDVRAGQDEGGLVLDLDENNLWLAAWPLRPGDVRMHVPLLTHEFLDKVWHVIVTWRERYGDTFPLRVLEGSTYTLMTFAAYLRWRAIDPRSLSVQTVHVYGDRLPRDLRTALADQYGARVEETYALAEVRAVARRCPECDLFHFDQAVLPEFVRPNSNAAVQEGLATLLLTELGPQDTETPLIRFDTGDLVWMSRVQCDQGIEAFEVLGRLAHSPRDPDTGEPLIPECVLAEAIAASGLARRASVPDWPGSPFATEALEARFRHEVTRTGCGLRLRLTVERTSEASADAAHEDVIRQRLIDAWPPLTGRESPLALEVHLVERLDDPHRSKWRPRSWIEEAVAGAQ